MTVLLERLHHHRLIGPGCPGPVEAVAWFGAVQAQELPSVAWAVAQRVAARAPTRDLWAAYDAGHVVRTHILRPTWHLVAAGDLRWMLALSAPRVRVLCDSGFRRLDIDTRTLLRSEGVMQRALDTAHVLTRRDLAAALEAAGIASDGQRIVYMLMHAELAGLICSGPRVGGQVGYALLDARVPPAPAVPRDEAVCRLVTRYLASHGPATVQDASWWSGLTLRDIRAGIAAAGDALACRRLDGRDCWSAAGAADAAHDEARRVTGVAHLLPNYDEFTVAYRDRTALLAPGTTPTSAAQSALLMQPVLIDGRHAGTWRRTLAGTPRPRPGQSTASDEGHVEVVVTPVRTLTRRARAALQEAADGYGEHLGRRARLVIADA